MAIFRYTASADTTITNAFEANLVTRGTGSNMGYADALEVFSIYGQESGSNGQSQELSRILIKFPIDAVKAEADDYKITHGIDVSVEAFNSYQRVRSNPDLLTFRRLSEEEYRKTFFQ